MKKQLTTTLCGSLLGLIMATTATATPHTKSYYDYAEVTAVEPLYRTVRVSQPIRECRDESVYVNDSRYRSHTPVILGGVIGGLLGHELGRKGHHSGLATAAGTVHRKSVV